MNNDTEIVYVYDDKHKNFLNDFVSKKTKIIKIKNNDVRKDIFDM